MIRFKLENREGGGGGGGGGTCIPMKLLKVENKIKDLMVVSLYDLGFRMKGKEQVL